MYCIMCVGKISSCHFLLTNVLHFTHFISRFNDSMVTHNSIEWWRTSYCWKKTFAIHITSTPLIWLHEIESNRIEIFMNQNPFELFIFIFWKNISEFTMYMYIVKFKREKKLSVWIYVHNMYRVSSLQSHLLSICVFGTTSNQIFMRMY